MDKVTLPDDGSIVTDFVKSFADNDFGSYEVGMTANDIISASLTAIECISQTFTLPADEQIQSANERFSSMLALSEVCRLANRSMWRAFVERKGGSND